MSALVLYFMLLKATMTSFSGLSSLPVLRDDLVVRHRVLTDRQLNTAVAVGRMGPGPIGLYVVSVGYFVAGVPGAIAGYLAMVTPAFVVLLLVRVAKGHAENPRFQRVVRSVLLAAAGLLIAATIPLARDALESVPMLAIAVVSFGLLAFTRIETMWVVLGAAAAGLLGLALL